MQPAEVHHPAHPGLLGSGGHVLRRTPLLGDEVARRAHRMDQVVDDVHALERRGQGFGFGQIPAHDLDLVAPVGAVEFGGFARHRPHRVAAAEQFGHEAAPDVAGRARHQALKLSRHYRSVRRCRRDAL